MTELLTVALVVLWNLGILAGLALSVWAVAREWEEAPW